MRDRMHPGAEAALHEIGHLVAGNAFGVTTGFVRNEADCLVTGFRQEIRTSHAGDALWMFASGITTYWLHRFSDAPDDRAAVLTAALFEQSFDTFLAAHGCASDAVAIRSLDAQGRVEATRLIYALAQMQLPLVRGASETVLRKTYENWVSTPVGTEIDIDTGRGIYLIAGIPLPGSAVH